MKIINVKGPVGNCRIDDYKILDLPVGLETLALEVIDGLRKEKIQELQYDSVVPPDSLCRSQSGFKSLTDSNLSEKTRDKINELAELYMWWTSRHWRANHPGFIGGGSSCVDCDHSDTCHGKYCPMWHCPSHEKWERILGPSYKRPERPSLPKLDL